MRSSLKFPAYCQRPVVLGMGKTGVSLISTLREAGITPLAWMDTRENPPLSPEVQASFSDVPMRWGGFDQALLRQASVIFISPGVSRQHPDLLGLPSTIPLYGDIELFTALVDVPIIGITGTNGKSTVTTLVGELLKAAGLRAVVAGNIGLPVLESLQGEQPDYYVLELSSYQLESIDHLPLFSAVVLNIAEDHMDHYEGDMTCYVAAKQRIYKGAQQAIINLDQPEAWDAIQVLNAVGVSQSKAGAGICGLAQREGGLWLMRGEEAIMPVNDMSLQTHHDVFNALAAMALTCSIAAVTPFILQTVFSTFQGLEHRCQCVAEIQGVRWIDDSKATNVSACVAALHSFGEVLGKRIVWIAGGQGKAADFSLLKTPVSQFVKIALLMGEDRWEIAHQVAGLTEVVLLESMEAAVSVANCWSQPGDIVLLSPACASLDIYRNFAERGEAFVTALMHQVEGNVSGAELR